MLRELPLVIYKTKYHDFFVESATFKCCDVE